MLRKTIQTALGHFGYKLARVQETQQRPSMYVLHEYRNPDGSFDYSRYQLVQKEGNRLKRDQVWVLEENIKFLAEYIAKSVPDPKFGLCHGTRQGKEQQWFSEALGCQVLGTEISESASDFPNTIQWDFHEVKPEWLGKVDFIYSNSFDHSYDPELCLGRWMSCLRKGGLCILEHTSGHEPRAANELDPFGAQLEIMPYLIAQWGKGRFHLREMLRAPRVRGELNFCTYLVVSNN